MLQELCSTRLPSLFEARTVVEPNGEALNEKEGAVPTIDRIILRVENLSKIVLVSIFFLTFPFTVTGAEIGAHPEQTNITIAYVSPSAAFTPLFVAAEAGLLAKYGLNGKLQFLSTTVAMQGLLAEEVDFCVDGPVFITPRLNGALVKYFGAYMQRYVFQI